MRSRLAPLFILLLLVAGAAGYARRSRPPEPVTPPAAPPVLLTPAPAPALPQAPDLAQIAEPHRLSSEELRAGLERYLNQGEGEAGARLEALLLSWGKAPPPDAHLVLQGDLSGDSVRESVIVMTTLASTTGRPEGAAYVISGTETRYRVDRSPSVETFGDFGGLLLYALADLTGSGRQQIIFAHLQRGAHTQTATIHVADWAPGGLVLLPGEISMSSLSELEVENREIRLFGGTIGSAGAGTAQRPRTDRYGWDGTALRLKDRQYLPSAYSYHLLIDGIVAEEFGRTADARAAYRLAMEPDRQAAGQGEMAMLPAEWEERFAEAVLAFARLRLALLSFKEGRVEEGLEISRRGPGRYEELHRAIAMARDHAAACTLMEGYLIAYPEFLEAINSPYGYANPHWRTADDLCGNLPSFR